VQDPTVLYELRPDVPHLDAPVLLHDLTGFVDAGGGARLAAQHLLATLEHDVLARFDVDQLVDYRARRPPMLFVRDHFESVEMPTLDIHLMRDAVGTPFLLLTGPEPDFQWERYAAAVVQLVRRLDVRLTVSLASIPWPAPHTRPLALTPHATDPTLVAGQPSWVDRITVPGNAAALVELCLGEAGHTAMGFAVHVPHYLAQVEYPASAAALLDAVAAATGLRLPTGTLHEAADRTRKEVDEQLAASPENQAAVQALEQQYDAVMRGHSPGEVLGAGTGLGAGTVTGFGVMPSADEIAAEFERYLADQDRPDT
jgi:predicted ATP-grasp superfamily ATP-dependent carboligase